MIWEIARTEGVKAAEMWWALICFSFAIASYIGWLYANHVIKKEDEQEKALKEE